MIKWGVLGIGNIANRFMKSLAHSTDGELYAVASYTEAKREAFQKSHPDIQVYKTYDDLLNDENIDAVYIAMRHADHYQWSKAALLKGKAVLCEKPATLTYRQTKELCDISKQNKVFFMEAMKTRFIPLVTDMKEMLRKGVIGDILKIETSFCYNIDYSQDYYLFDKKQGGILYDVGSYNILATFDFITSNIKSFKTTCQKNYGVDVYDTVEIFYESGQTALLEMAMDRDKEKTIKIEGTLGTLYATPFYRPTSFTIELNDGQTITHEKDYVYDDFYGEIEEVHKCLKHHCYESRRMLHRDSKSCVLFMELIKESIDG